jgi:hypothetical protein
MGRNSNGIDAIAMLEHNLFVARSKATRGDISRGTFQAAQIMRAARNQRSNDLLVGRSLKGTRSPSNAVKTLDPFERATSGRSKFYQFNGRTFGGAAKVRVCKV